jgi:dTDP-4-amino-4,6-dideoxygalactose transaminase
VLSAKLRRLDGWNQQRREAAARYAQLLADLEQVRTPMTLEGNEHVWHLYVVRVPGRDEVFERLNAEGVSAGIHYPRPIHLQGAFADLDHGEGDFPEAESAAREILSLPMYPGISADQQEQVVEALRRALP